MSKNGMKTSSWDGGPGFGEFLKRAEDEVLPKILSAEVFCAIVPHQSYGPDLKFSLEMGLAAQQNKPIILLVRPGVDVPRKIALLADEIVNLDIDEYPALVQPTVLEAMDRLAERGVIK